MSEGFEPGRPQDPTGGWSVPSGPPSYPPAADPTGTGTAPGGGQIPPGFAESDTSGGQGGGGGSKTWIVALVALLVGLLVGGGVGWAVGGDDDVASGDGVAAEWQPFCDRAEELAAMGDVDLDDDEEAALMAEMAGLTPERYRDRLDALTKLDELEDTDALDDAFQMFGELLGQVMWLVGTLEVECGIDPESEFFESSLETSGDWSLDSDLEGDWDVGSGGTADDDPFGEEDDEDEGPMSLTAIKAVVEDELPDVYENINSWSVFNAAIVEVDSYSVPLDADDAMAVCEVLVEHIAEHAPDGTVEVLSEGEVVASGPAGGPCSAT